MSEIQTFVDVMTLQWQNVGNKYNGNNNYSASTATTVDVTVLICCTSFVFFVFYLQHCVGNDEVASGRGHHAQFDECRYNSFGAFGSGLDHTTSL